MMKKGTNKSQVDEYDFSKGVRGKYAKRYAETANVIVLDSDIASFFPDSASVNDALRALVTIARRQKTNRSVK
jgi:hypothetical protein